MINLGFFSVDKSKEVIKPGNEVIVTFKFTPPQKDETISNIEALQGLG